MALAALGVTPAAALPCNNWNGGDGNWNIASNWSLNHTPQAGEAACITAPGTYTVSVTTTAMVGGNASPDELQLGASGPNPGIQTLAIVGNALGGARFQAAGMVNANGRINLDSTDPSADANLCSAAGLTIAGTLDISPGAGGTRTLQGALINQGAMKVNTDTVMPSSVSCGANSITNSGTLSIAASTTLTDNATFSQTAGTTAVSGSMAAGGPFSITGGTFTGNVPVLRNPNTLVASGGSGTFKVHGPGGGLGSDVGPGITIVVEANATEDATLTTTAGAKTNAGTIQVTSTDATHSGQIEAGSGGLTNTGTIQTLSGALSTQFLGGMIDNQGTMTLDGGADGFCCSSGSLQLTTSGSITVASGKTFALGSFSQTAGTTTVSGSMTSPAPFSITGGALAGNAPVLTNPNTLKASGGTGTIKVHGTGSLAQANIGSGITIIVEASGADAALNGPAASFTNAGTIQLTATSNNNASFDGGGGTMTNSGTIETLPGSGGTRTLFEKIANSGTITIGANTGGGCCSSGNLQLTNSGAITVASGKTFTLGGIFSQSAGTTTVDGTLTAPAATFPISGGTVRGGGTLIGNVSNTGGTFAPGSSPGTLTVTGNYTQGAGGTLAVDVAGTTAGTGYDRLSVSGNVSLDGSLAIATGTGFTPPSGQTYQVVTAGGTRTGTFATVTGTDAGGGAHYAVQYNPANVTLAPRFDLSVAKSGTGSGTVTSDVGGIDCGATCAHTYDDATPVTLTATPASPSTFTGWTGAGCSGTGTCQVTMSQARSITAGFAAPAPPPPATFSLSVSKAGAGGGSVTSSPAGIDCGATCSASYDDQTSVTLTAAPDSGSQFDGWSGDCTGTGGCTVTMSAARSVTATFSKIVAPPSLTSKATLKGSTFTATAAGVVTLPVGNPNGLAAQGDVTLTTLSLVGIKHKKKIVKIGHATFTVLANGVTRVKVHLNKKGRALLKKHKKLTVKTIVVLKANGTSKSRTFTITIKAPKKKH
ncbi:MAG: hypothetical protein QOE38_787 [Thermoleophilaceae bacterium]|nr:hypothetical protein [Thermoleophilaceae bacterium]